MVGALEENQLHPILRESTTPHASPAVQALIASAIPYRNVPAGVAHRRVAHHLAEMLVEDAAGAVGVRALVR